MLLVGYPWPIGGKDNQLQKLTPDLETTRASSQWMQTTSKNNLCFFCVRGHDNSIVPETADQMPFSAILCQPGSEISSPTRSNSNIAIPKKLARESTLQHHPPYQSFSRSEFDSNKHNPIYLYFNKHTSHRLGL